MNREITIPSLNDGKPFEMPKRKPKHRIKMYEKMIDLEKEKPGEMKNDNYKNLIEGVYLVLYMIQDTFPKATIDDVLNISDDIDEDNNILKLTCIAYGSDFEKIKKAIKGDGGTENFQKGKTTPLTKSNLNK